MENIWSGAVCGELRDQDQLLASISALLATTEEKRLRSMSCEEPSEAASEQYYELMKTVEEVINSFQLT